jgi:hypothetical protein
MHATSRTTIARLALAAAFLGAVVAAGCAPSASQSVAPSATAPAAVAPPSTTPSVAPSTTTTTAPPVDASGAAIGKSLTVGSAKETSQIGKIARPSDKTALAESIKVLQQDQQIGKVKSASVRGMTQDKKGRWWVLLTVTDDLAGTNQVVMTYDGKSWQDSIMGAEVNDDDLPADVRF